MRAPNCPASPPCMTERGRKEQETPSQDPPDFTEASTQLQLSNTVLSVFYVGAASGGFGGAPSRACRLQDIAPPPQRHLGRPPYAQLLHLGRLWRSGLSAPASSSRLLQIRTSHREDSSPDMQPSPLPPDPSLTPVEFCSCGVRKHLQPRSRSRVTPLEAFKTPKVRPSRFPLG